MPKKLILAITILYSSLFSATNEQIINYFKAQIPIPSVSIKIDSRIQINGFDNMEYITLHVSDGLRVQKISIFTKGDLIFPDVISVKDGESIKEKLNQKKLISSLAKVYKNEKRENIITLGNDPTKETLVSFIDPECPFCAKEIEDIDKKLKIYNLKLIFTPVHDGSALEKSALIYQKVAKTKKQKEKIKIIKKYFSGDIDVKIREKDIAKIEQLRRKYFHAGLKGVPFYVNEKKLLTYYP